LGAAGLVYASTKKIPHWAAWPALAAFLIEYPFYLVPAFPRIRQRFSGSRLIGYTLAAALLPYLAASMGAVPFAWSSLLRLTGLAIVLSLWYRILPARPWSDLVFLAIFPVALLGGYFDGIYRPLFPGLKDLIVLGHLALICVAVMVLLVQRGVPESRYGFLPNSREWRIGVLHYLGFIPIGVPLTLLIQAARLRDTPPGWNIVAQFLGVLWVLALSEEFFFRGVLQPWTEAWTSSRATALLLTSALYGLVHITFRGFPNWRWVLVTSILGCFCGMARNRGGSIRASMVTHALVVTTWRAFFTA
jgi:membrane protease YdiL (CAAX protease family)